MVGPDILHMTSKDGRTRQGWKFCIFGQRGCEPKKVWEPKPKKGKKGDKK